MKWLDRLEKRYGAYSAPNVTLWLIAGQAVVFLAQFVGPMAEAGGAGAVAQGLALDPEKVLAGEWWRLLTFPFLAPLGTFPLLVLFFFWFFYFIGTTLEAEWGQFRYNLYLLLGYLATIAAAFIAHAIRPGAGLVVGDYLYGSLFLAFARLYPEFEILLMLLLPVKVKWLARLQWAFYWYIAIFGDWYSRLMALAAVFNYLVFFGRDVAREARRGQKQMRRRAKTAKPAVAVLHECRVCGLNSKMSPKTAFRYCSKCAGQQCYCPEHINNHEHVTEDDA